MCGVCQFITFFVRDIGMDKEVSEIFRSPIAAHQLLLVYEVCGRTASEHFPVLVEDALECPIERVKSAYKEDFVIVIVFLGFEGQERLSVCLSDLKCCLYDEI